MHQGFRAQLLERTSEILLNLEPFAGSPPLGLTGDATLLVFLGIRDTYGSAVWLMIAST